MTMRISGNDPLELLKLGTLLGGGEEEAEGADETPITPAATAPAPAAQEAVSAPVPEPQPEEQWNDIRDYAKANGLNIDHIQDSEAAARYLIDMARNNSA